MTTPIAITATDLRPSAAASLADVRTRYPGAGLLALGQTVWWDEPLKAVLRVMLDALGLGGHMVLGVHDTDYFARVRTRLAGQGRYVLMPHNDGATRDLWSAAGEVSRLFGSEHYPTRHDLGRHGVSLKRLAAAAATGNAAGAAGTIDRATEAWGWRGLVYTGSRNLIVHSMKLADVAGGIDEMLRWGFDGTVESIEDECCRGEARLIAESLLRWVREFALSSPNATLSNLYQHLFPRLMELLLGEPPNDVEVSCTGHLLLLRPDTADLPRFEFLDLFLRERTRALAAAAYNGALAGTEMYKLDRFGLGALPFDVVTTQHGRGTLRVTLRAVHIETPTPIRLPLYRPIEGVRDLAGLLTRELGQHVTVVGKAVALIPMLAREFLFVFSEEGSGYVGRTRRMLDHLAAHGVPFPVHPIVRLHYQTWDSLSVSRSTLRLPNHMRAAFGAGSLPSAEIAGRWRDTVAAQAAVLAEIQGLTKPLDLMRFLAARKGTDWEGRAARYSAAQDTLLRLRGQGEVLQAEIAESWVRLARIREEIRLTEKARGDHFRGTQEWTADEEARREAFAARLAELHLERRATVVRIAEVNAARLAIERGPEALAARAERAALEVRADAERLELVRGAILTQGGLTHTDHRPSAWWFPMVDPTGAWFRRLVETTEVYLEPLNSA